jgi:hypothetical protein
MFRRWDLIVWEVGGFGVMLVARRSLGLFRGRDLISRKVVRFGVMLVARRSLGGIGRGNMIVRVEWRLRRVGTGSVWGARSGIWVRQRIRWCDVAGHRHLGV